MSRMLGRIRRVLDVAPAGALDPAALVRTFTVQAGDMVLAAIAGPLLAAVARDAPG
ncbi:hypothetical protein [Pseudonocardia sp. GCM10023141]|uniref:hypothetical protein n=1 Tax=Pseudonocardia sp. GCM10023141 TaxID=3252653 RepID=UPI00361A5708